jgi:hypothetical protein
VMAVALDEDVEGPPPAREALPNEGVIVGSRPRGVHHISPLASSPHAATLAPLLAYEARRRVGQRRRWERKETDSHAALIRLDLSHPNEVTGERGPLTFAFPLRIVRACCH